MSEREVHWSGLMRAANAGDAAAYGRFLQALAPVLRDSIRRGLKRAGLSDADAEDILQETLLAIHLKRHTWHPDAPVGPWVHAIARHKLVDALRRQGRAIHVPIDDFENVLTDGAGEPHTLTADVERHLSALSVRQRDVVSAIALDGQSISEAARRLAMSEGAVRVALHRGLAALSAKLRP